MATDETQMKHGMETTPAISAVANPCSIRVSSVAKNMSSYHLDHLQYLETEAIHVLREVAAEFERPAILFSGGKDSICILRQAPNQGRCQIKASSLACQTACLMPVTTSNPLHASSVAACHPQADRAWCKAINHRVGPGNEMFMDPYRVSKVGSTQVMTPVITAPARSSTTSG